MPNEIARADVSIDNTKCNLNMHEVIFSLEQHLSLKASDRIHREIITLLEHRMNGAAARSRIETMRIELNLS